MSKVIPIKEFRANLSMFADLVEKGTEILVIRRSRPAFKVVPLADDEKKGEWKTLLDFTEDYPEGIPAEELLKQIQKFEKKNG